MAKASQLPDDRARLMAELQEHAQQLTFVDLEALVARIKGRLPTGPRRDLLPRVLPSWPARAVQLHRMATDQLEFMIRVESSSPTAATAARAKLVALEQDLARVLQEHAIAKMKSPINQARARARLAASEGSWVAAEKFESVAHDLKVEEEHEKELRRQRRFSGLTEDELLAMMVEALPGLSPPGRARLTDALRTGKG